MNSYGVMCRESGSIHQGIAAALGIVGTATVSLLKLENSIHKQDHHTDKKEKKKEKSRGIIVQHFTIEYNSGSGA